MHKLYELKEMMCDELEKYGDKKELSAGTLDVVDKLAHTIKNLDKIIEKYEEDGGMSYDDGMSYERGGRGGNRGGQSYRGGMSYARGGGRGARRDSMGRYSSAGDEIVMELKEIMTDAPKEVRMDFKNLIDKLERM